MPTVTTKCLICGNEFETAAPDSGFRAAQVGWALVAPCQKCLPESDFVPGTYQIVSVDSGAALVAVAR